MRLTVVGPAYPHRGGIAHHVYWLKQELNNLGHEVQVISFRRLYPRLFFPGTTPTDPSEMIFDPGGAPLLDALNPFTWRAAFQKARSFAPNAILLEWWHPFFAPLVGMLGRWFRKAGIKTIIECHNVYPHEPSVMDRPLIRFAFSSTRYFITHSSLDRDRIQREFPGKVVRVAPLPTRKEFSHPEPPSRTVSTLLFFGIVRKYKGLEVLLEAMPLVLSKIKCRLVIAGEFYEPVERYQRLIREHRLEPFVHIENRYVPNEEVGGLFAQADVMVLPYLDTSQSAVAGMALAAGLPVIASRVGGLPEVIRENVTGLLVPPGDAPAMAEAILNYFSNQLGPSFRKNLQAPPPLPECGSIGRVVEDLAQMDETPKSEWGKESD
jgi:glycosyltransferase involved in cell wall biosynthesis